MKKTIFAIAGLALIVLSTSQFAAANEHRDRARRHVASEPRDSNASFAPAYESAAETYRYNGGWSAPAGR